MEPRIRTLLIDDETHSLDSLQIEIAQHCPELEILELCKGAKAGIEAVRKHDPDLIFLDIDMPAMNGFEMLEHLQGGKFEVIFATAYDEYAVRAIKVSAMDYLLKPVDPEDLKRSVARVVDKRNSNDASMRMDVLLTNLRSTTSGFTKLAVPTSEGLELIDMIDVIMCEADGSYAKIYTSDGKSYLVSRTLKEITEMLDNPSFFRTHQSYLVNLQHAKKYVRGSGGHLVMSNGKTAQVARARKEELMTVILRKG